MKKLRQERGATIMMALLLLLLATMVSTVILLAVTSIARRIESDRTTQQNYLTVSSAAELIRDSIQSTSYTRIESEKSQYDEEAQQWIVVSHDLSYTRPSGLMAEWLSYGIDDSSADGRLGGYTDTIELTVPKAGATDTGDDLKTVKAELTMDQSLKVTVQLSLADGGAEDCRMTLTLLGERVEGPWSTRSEGDTSEERSQKIVINWGSAKITKGASK